MVIGAVLPADKSCQILSKFQLVGHQYDSSVHGIGPLVGVYVHVCMYTGMHICDPLPRNETQVRNSEIEVLTQCDRGEHLLQNGERIMFLS